MGKIRVLNITSTRYGIGGVERLLLDMSDKFDRTEFELSYCNLFCEQDSSGAFPTELNRRGLRQFVIPGKRFWEIPLMLLRLIRLLRREQFDIVHLHMMKATLLGYIAVCFCDSIHVITCHYTRRLIEKYPPPIRWLERAAMNSAARIIAISEYVKEDMIAGGVSADKIAVIHNGIDIDSFDSASKNSQHSETRREGFIICSVGSLTHRKGQSYLINAFPKIMHVRPDAVLWIVGEGPLRASLEELTEKLGIRNKVDFKGFVEKVPALLAKIDLYVHPAVDEPFGIAVLEAMVAGKPTVATAVDGVREIIRDGETGRLVKSQDPDALADAVIELIDNVEMRGAIAARAREDIEDRFDISRMVSGYEQVYREQCSEVTALR
ncbi:MAG: glycosyltransferase family 4 protein [Acidobacteriota bacterium]|nr:MAG: glycosyltransferase family 4 protein [Acidobacteriota bacterium]